MASSNIQSADPYKEKSLEDPPLVQKIEDLVDFISETKFGMLTTKASDSDLLTSRCMALAGKVHPCLPPNTRNPPHSIRY